MQFILTEINYNATVVALEKFVEIPGALNIKSAIIFNNSIIVGKDAKEGDIGLFFPVETQLSSDFLHNNNLYDNPLKNKDTTKKGFFGNNGRVILINNIK